MTPEQLARVGNDADEALQRGEHKRAASLYHQLETHEPDNPRWPAALALVLRKFGQRPQAAVALMRAVRIHVANRDTVRAVAMIKQVLAIDPQHAEARAALGSLHRASARQAGPGGGGARAAPASGAGSAAAVRTGAGATASAGPSRTSIGGAAPGASGPTRSAARPLDQVPLRDLLPGAVRRGPPASSGPAAYRIPLAEDAGAPPLVLDSSAHFAPPPPSAAESFALEDAALELVARETMLAQRVQAVLPAVPLFAELAPAALEVLVEAAELRELEQGQTLFRQGDAGDALFVVSDGLIGVIDEGPPRRGVARLGPGQVFGEIALLTEARRTGTTVALAPTQVVAIGRSAVSAAIDADSTTLPALLRFLRDRLVERLLSTHPLFVVLSPSDRERIKARFGFLEVEAGALLIEEGQPPDDLLVLLSGAAEVVRADGQRIATVGAGDLVGEMSLLAQTPAIAHVRATTKTLAIELSGADFLRILGSRPEAKAFVEQLMKSRRASLRWA